MIGLQWNALRLGHCVLVHDDDGRDMSLAPGVVTMIRTTVGSNDIGIRITQAGGGSRIVRPRRLAVHLEQLDPTEQCWRCAVSAARARSSTDPTPRPDPNVEQPLGTTGSIHA